MRRIGQRYFPYILGEKAEAEVIIQLIQDRLEYMIRSLNSTTYKLSGAYIIPLCLVVCPQGKTK